MWPELEKKTKAISQVLLSNQPLCRSCQKGKWVTAHDSPEVQRREQRFFLHPSQHTRALEFFLPPLLPPLLPLLPPAIKSLWAGPQPLCICSEKPLQLQVLLWEKQLSVKANNSSFSKFSHCFFTLLWARELQEDEGVLHTSIYIKNFVPH